MELKEDEMAEDVIDASNAIIGRKMNDLLMLKTTRMNRRRRRDRKVECIKGNHW